MIGAMRAIALLKPNVRVIGVRLRQREHAQTARRRSPATCRRAMNGKTIEIINTDAEGRLVLADGLPTRAAGRHPPDRRRHAHRRLRGRAGLCQRRRLLQRRRAWEQFERRHSPVGGEKCGGCPSGEEYAELIKSDIADIKNTGGRWGGAISAADLPERNSWKILRGFTWTSPARPGSKTAKRGSPKDPAASPCGPAQRSRPPIPASPCGPASRTAGR
jgi:leucyl aminopeptidase